MNCNTYLLGRNGYFTLNFSTSADQIDSQKEIARDLLAHLSFMPGKSYEEFNGSTDKIAAYVRYTCGGRDRGEEAWPARPCWSLRAQIRKDHRGRGHRRRDGHREILPGSEGRMTGLPCAPQPPVTHTTGWDRGSSPALATLKLPSHR